MSEIVLVAAYKEFEPPLSDIDVHKYIHSNLPLLPVGWRQIGTNEINDWFEIRFKGPLETKDQTRKILNDSFEIIKKYNIIPSYVITNDLANIPRPPTFRNTLSRQRYKTSLKRRIKERARRERERTSRKPSRSRRKPSRSRRKPSRSRRKPSRSRRKPSRSRRKRK